jgi:hypothetical protein
VDHPGGDRAFQLREQQELELLHPLGVDVGHGRRS